MKIILSAAYHPFAPLEFDHFLFQRINRVSTGLPWLSLGTITQAQADAVQSSFTKAMKPSQQ